MHLESLRDDQRARPHCGLSPPPTPTLPPQTPGHFHFGDPQPKEGDLLRRARAGHLLDIFLCPGAWCCVAVLMEGTDNLLPFILQLVYPPPPPPLEITPPPLQSLPGGGGGGHFPQEA